VRTAASESGHGQQIHFRGGSDWVRAAMGATSSPRASFPTRLVVLVIGALLLAIAALSLLPGRTSLALAADDCPNADVRAEQQSQFLPDCRAYEIVSPYPTGGVPIYEGYAFADSEDGRRVLLRSIQPFPIDEVMPFGDQRGYLAERGGDGWTVTPTGLPVSDGEGTISRDGSSMIDRLVINVDPDDQNPGAGAQPGGADVYLRKSATGEIVWLSRDQRIPIGTPQPGQPGYSEMRAITALGFPGMSSMSVDGSVSVFLSRESLVDEDLTSSADLSLYKWTDNGTTLGELEFIGKHPDGSVPSGGSTLAEYGESAGSLSATMLVNSVSVDGSRIVYRTTASAGAHGQRYLHIDGEPPRLIAKATGVPPIDDPAQVSYVGGDRDLHRVYFTSASRLTPNAGASSLQPDLYVYDVASDEVQDLTPRLDGGTDPEVDPEPEDQARVRGVAAFSDDGKRVFFVADGVLETSPSPEGDLPDPNGNNLYMAELEEFGGPVRTEFIATLSSEDASQVTDDWHVRTAYASPDGEVLGFGATTDLTGTDIGGLQQVFVYDVSEHTLECASCPQDGTPPTDPVNLTTAGPLWQQFGGDAIKRWVSSDGTVLFHTATKLSARDRNGVEDVYAYRDGDRYLISSGIGGRRSRLTGASRDGSTIFFVTGDPLVPNDEEPGIFKLYAAVSGGGVGSDAPTDPACEGDDCQGEIATPPEEPDSGSASLHGDGNPPVTPRDCSRLARRASKLKQRSKRLRRKVRIAPEGTKRAKTLKRRAKQAKRDARRAVGKARACKSGGEG
jgi:hypothetical protein